MGTTAIGMEVAIPHAKSEAVKAPALTAITVPDGVDYEAPDGAPCKLIFMIAATLDGDVHLEVLARLMQMLMHEDFTAKLKARAQGCSCRKDRLPCTGCHRLPDRYCAYLHGSGSSRQGRR